MKLHELLAEYEDTVVAVTHDTDNDWIVIYTTKGRAYVLQRWGSNGMEFRPENVTVVSTLERPKS